MVEGFFCSRKHIRIKQAVPFGTALLHHMDFSYESYSSAP